jgi:hypothetical protein
VKCSLRFYSPAVLRHHFTASEAEKDWIIATFPPNVWTYEGTAFCVYTTQAAGTSPVYRFYSPVLVTHHYTISEAEKNWIINTFPPDVWNYEGISYYAIPY